MSETELTELVREALQHLYETSYLQTHPLASRLVGDSTGESRGRALRRRLLAAIEQIRPPDDTPPHSLAWRHHRYLTLRYVDGLEHCRAAAELGLTERHLQRIRHDALLELTSVLFEPVLDFPTGGPRGAAKATAGGAIPAASPESRPATGLLTTELFASELSRVDAAQEQPASLHETLRSIVQTLEPLASSVGVDLAVELDPRSDVSTSRTFLRQTFLNLLVHAIHAQPGGSVSVRTDARPESMRVYVAVRGRESSAPAVGCADADEHLVLARRFAETRGALIRAEREGDVYLLSLSLPSDRRMRRVLLIDDNPDFLLLFRRYLADAGYEVSATSDSSAALSLAQQVKPDVITLDVLMPHQDGWETLQRLKNHLQTRHVPVIVCSVIGDRELAFSLGASGFLPKPIDQSSLMAALDQAIQSAGFSVPAGAPAGG